MNWQIILNPYTRFSEKQLLVVGVLSSIVGCLIASTLGITYDGLLDVHLRSGMTFQIAVQENSIVIILITLILFVYGKVINSKTRFIDILNSCLLFRIPLYLSALLTSIPIIKNLEKEVMRNINSLDKINLQPLDLIGLFFISTLLIVLLLYSIVLLFYGFKTATNAKKTVHYIGFGIIILLAEVVSKIVLSLI